MDLRTAITQFFNCANRHDLGEMEVLLTDEVQFHFPKTGPLLGKKRILKFFGILFRQYPQLTFRIRKTITEESNAAVHWTNKGVNRRGEPYENEGVTILTFRDGKIDFISDFFKDTEKF